MRFYAIVLFMASMVGLATAQDLILLFIFWDLTAVACYLLIGFDRQDAEARRSTLMALLVAGISAVGLLVGILLLRVEYGTTQLPEIIGRAEAGRREAARRCTPPPRPRSWGSPRCWPRARSAVTAPSPRARCSSWRF